MDINRELRNLVSTGEVYFGQRQALKALKGKKAKIIIAASNCPTVELDKVKAVSGAKVFKFEGTNVDLGAACGKPFTVSMITVIKEGESRILDLA